MGKSTGFLEYNREVPQDRAPLERIKDFKKKNYSWLKNLSSYEKFLLFIKPRILDKEGVIAVIHSVFIAEKYTGFPVTYFSKNFISQSEFATGWAREEYVARDQIVSSATLVGERTEPQEYDLEKWIDQKKVRWLVEDKDDLLLNNETDLYPYHQIAGRRNPYLMQDGKVIDIPNVEEVITKTTLETFMPGQ